MNKTYTPPPTQTIEIGTEMQNGHTPLAVFKGETYGVVLATSETVGHYATWNFRLDQQATFSGRYHAGDLQSARKDFIERVADTLALDIDASEIKAYDEV